MSMKFTVHCCAKGCSEKFEIDERSLSEILVPQPDYIYGPNHPRPKLPEGWMIIHRFHEEKIELPKGMQAPKFEFGGGEHAPDIQVTTIPMDLGSMTYIERYIVCDLHELTAILPPPGPAKI